MKDDEDHQITPWRSVLNCEAAQGLKNLATPNLVSSDKPSYLTEFVLRREREEGAGQEINLEELLEGEKRISGKKKLTGKTL